MIFTIGYRVVAFLTLLLLAAAAVRWGFDV
jgi:hypothetical protein